GQIGGWQTGQRCARHHRLGLRVEGRRAMNRRRLSQRHDAPDTTKAPGRVPLTRTIAEESDGLADQLFLDASGLTRTAAQIIKFSTAHIATALDLDTGDLRRIQLERTFHGLARGDLAYREGGVQAAIATADHDALVGLGAAALAFDNVHADHDGVAGAEFGDRAARGQARDFFLFQGFDEIHTRLQASYPRHWIKLWPRQRMR